MRVFLSLFFCLIALPCLAQNLTQFTPDVVMECRDSQSGNLMNNCTYLCWTVPTPANNAMASWPSISWNFERMEFFSKPDHQSESWLIAMKGRLQSPAIKTDTISFLTLGRSYLCTYTGTEVVPGRPNSVVKLVKYY
jgi:hypothetical protein